jgi:hypothetical protein
MGNRVALLMGFVTEFDTVVGGSRMRDSNAEFKGPVPIAQEDCSEGVGGDRVAELESHSIFADVFASPRQGRLLNSELDWKVNGEPRRPIIELLHTRPPQPVEPDATLANSVSIKIFGNRRFPPFSTFAVLTIGPLTSITKYC